AHARRTAHPAARPAQAPRLQPVRPAEGTLMNLRLPIALCLAVAVLGGCKRPAEEPVAPKAPSTQPAAQTPEPPASDEAHAPAGNGDEGAETPALQVVTVDGKA